MKYYMDWDGKTYLHFDSINDINMGNLSKEIIDWANSLTTQYDINKQNLNFLKKNKPASYCVCQQYDNKGNKIGNTEIIKLARLCWNYISGETDDLSFLNGYKDKI